ncbi:hypothetical protein FMM58_06520 [Campylobacter sp. LR291e]|uniref:hypothetical protein n=1 Tax=Campylobacter sp. LR291e TaxID=2593546 RepID=UPI00123BB4AA|nr:hypothetical protein [Campylobacter sp. LR291e]KAA6230323.1 hypothetical protein FMM58_06520 [Campylobacter sp. LR291e]
MILKNDNNEILEDSFSFLPFRIIKIVLKKDNAFTKSLLDKAKNRLQEINFNKTDSAGLKRNDDEIKFKAYSGLIIEQLCFMLLKHYNKNSNVEVLLDNSNNSINQVDLR